MSSDAIFSPFLSTISSALPLEERRVTEKTDQEFETKAEINNLETDAVIKTSNKRPLNNFLDVKFETSSEGKEETFNRTFSRLEDIQRPSKAPRIENIQMFKEDHKRNQDSTHTSSSASLPMEKTE